MAEIPDKTVRNPVLAPKRGLLTRLRAYLTQNRLGDLLVIRGHLTPDTLDHALALARARGHKIGRVLLDEHLIRPHHLYTTLGTQWSVRTLAYSSALVVSLASFMPRTARADEMRASYASVQTLTINSGMRFAVPDAGPVAQPQKHIAYPALFGSGEKQSTDLSAFTKWTTMFERYNAQVESNAMPVTLARINPASGGDAAISTTIAERARLVDAQMNRVPYVDDQQNWGKSDYWETPAEFLTRGGDCEDFAIAKYMALKKMGVAENNMRIAIVHDMVKNMPHAILIVYSEEGPLVLDNQSKITHKADEITRYKPIFSINATTWWLHTKGADVQVATAAQ